MKKYLATSIILLSCLASYASHDRTSRTVFETTVFNGVNTCSTNLNPNVCPNIRYVVVDTNITSDFNTQLCFTEIESQHSSQNNSYTVCGNRETDNGFTKVSTIVDNTRELRLIRKLRNDTYQYVSRSTLSNNDFIEINTILRKRSTQNPDSPSYPRHRYPSYP